MHLLSDSAPESGMVTTSEEAGVMAALTSGKSSAVAPRLMVAACGLFSAAAALYAGELATSPAASKAVVWGSWALAAYIAGLLCLVGRMQASFRQSAGLGIASCQLGSWLLLWYGLAFGLATATWNWPHAAGSASQVAVSSVLRALGLIATGMTFWTTGYLVGPGSLTRWLARGGMASLQSRWTDVVRGTITPWALYGVGMLARAASVAATGKLGYVGEPASALGTATGYDQIFSDVSLFCPLAICAAAFQVYSERLRGQRVTLVILFGIEVAFGAASGGKQSFVVAVLAVVIPMSAARYRPPKFAVVAGILIFLVIVIPFNQAYRQSLRSGSGIVSVSQAIDRAPEILRQTFTSQSLIDILPSSTAYLLQRTQEIEGPAIILQRTPGQIPYTSPTKLIEAPLVEMVPRAIWAGKPVLDPGYQFSQQYYGIPASTPTASSISPIGDLYRHGGWLPVITGMFLFGCGVRLLDDTLDVRLNPHAAFLALLIYPNIAKGESDWVTFISTIPAVSVVWLLAVAFTFAKKRGE